MTELGRQWTRSGAVPILLALMWSTGISLYLAVTPFDLGGGEPLTIVEAGGFAGLVLVTLPVVFSGAPLTVGPGRTRWLIAIVCAVALSLLVLAAPAALGLYLPAAVIQWFTVLQSRRAAREEAAPRPKPRPSRFE